MRHPWGPVCLIKETPWLLTFNTVLLYAGNGGAPQGPGPSPRNGVLRSFVATDLGPHLDKQEYPELGLQVAVHQRTGVDHKRNNTGKWVSPACCLLHSLRGS
jgi:hypothetical protein